MRIYILLAFLMGSMSVLASPTLKAQNSPPDYMIESVRATEAMLEGSDDASIWSFINENMKVDESRDEQRLFDHLKELRAEVRDKMNNITIEPAAEGLIFTFSGSDSSVKVRMQATPEGITELKKISEEKLELYDINRESITDLFLEAEQRGMAGVVHIVKDGELLISKGFGYANKELGILNKTNTIFGIGSRPIDFTKAAIFHLEQRGMLRTDETIAAYLDDVPADKHSMTIQHLMTGRSGLPDFFHTENDSDPDLQWIDRKTAEERIMNLPLLFEPGTDRRHSHTAFGLLAILVEKISGMSYEEYLQRYFFEPTAMSKTGNYGDQRIHSLEDFAVGSGPQIVGLPNIPPNWGPTSWLIKGSGGMYSSLPDLLNFYKLVRSDEVLEAKYSQQFREPSVTLDGSDRGFELFNIYESEDDQLYLFLNSHADRMEMMRLFRSLEAFMITE
jgi:CubicO group peptidase (beta-lactamase class C family)